MGLFRIKHYGKQSRLVHKLLSLQFAGRRVEEEEEKEEETEEEEDERFDHFPYITLVMFSSYFNLSVSRYRNTRGS